jgi:two-component system, NtrC family, sensor histidine kinase AtoS
MSASDQLPEHTLDLGTAGPRLDAFTDSYILFKETTRKYREAYEQLEAQFESLNVKLEDTNLELRRSLEEKDRVSNYLNNILESLTGGVLVVDAQGEIALLNRAAEDITGRTQEEALGQPYEKAIGLDSGRRNSVLHTLETGESLSNREKVLTHPDGRSIPLGFSTSMVRDEAGTVLGAVEVFNDMTEVKRLEAEVQRAHTLAALGEMAATVAHEIRNPLSGIANFASLLGRDLETDDPRRRLVNKITEGIGRLNRIVTSLLTYTRPLSLNAHQVNLVDLIEEATAFFEIGLERDRDNVTVKRDYQTPESICCIDPEQFQQVILNLLQNAVQAMPEGGCVTIAVAPGPDEAGALFSVRDTGAGMTADIQEKLFTPFFTTKEDGTGLGLATSRKIVEAHGGQIHVESEPGAGTCFSVTIPQ